VGAPASKYKSTQSLHELGLDNYPNPDMPESSRLTRKEEKQSLQNLNNRLAGYIDRVRTLQRENLQLTRQIRTFEEHQTVEISHVKDMYNKQIDDLKSSLDAMNKQYNQLKVGAEGLLQENEDIKGKLKKKDSDLNTTQGRVRSLEDELRNMVNKLSRLESEKASMQSQLDDSLPEVKSLRDKLVEAKRALDEEQLKSAGLGNTCARLEEDLKFKMQLLEKELQEVKQRKEVEITEMDGKLQEEYEDRLQKALEQLREIYDDKMRQNREDYEKIYEDRVRELQTQLSSARGSNASTHQELKESKARIISLMSKVSDLEGANLALNQKIADLAQEIDDQKSISRAQLAAKDDEIKRLLDELANQLKEYQNLQDIKVALDMEIAVYRRLIEVEEDRLGIHDKSMDMSDSSASNSSRTPPARVSVERTSESREFQRKVTVSQTQL
jgi:lamin B